MGKIVDITEKLSFSENPVIAIKDEKYEINADAETVLKIMGTFQESEDTAEISLKSLDLLFNKNDIKKLRKLSFKDLIQVIDIAMKLATGEEEAEGE